MAGKNNNKRRLLTLLIVVSVFTAFAYGVVVGTYRVVPFEQLQAVKKYFAGRSSGSNAHKTIDKKKINYENRVGIFEIYEITSDVVMIGDSMTDNAEWSEMFPSIAIANRGIGGDTTRGVLRRIETILSTGAKKAFIMIGINDISEGISVDAVFSNYEKIMDELLTNGIQPYIQSTLFAGEEGKKYNDQVSELNMRLKDFAARKNIRFIDINALLAKNGVLDSQFVGGAIHLNAAGYKIWKESIEAFLLPESVSADIGASAVNSRSDPINGSPSKSQ